MDRQPKTIIVAEIGINHNGSLETAKEMIIKAKEAGADVVKFQKRDPDIAVPEDQKLIEKDTIFGVMPYIEYKRKIEFWESEFEEIDRLCREIRIEWTASVWDGESLKFLLNPKFNVPYIKVPSALLSDLKLISEICQTGRNIVVSTGMSSESEVNAAVRTIRENNATSRATILHCISAYPVKDEDINLDTIHALKWQHPGVKVGYSGHEKGILASAIAVSLGAVMIERHVTLSRNLPGTDQAASLEFNEFEEMVRLIRKTETWLGTPKTKVLEDEWPNRIKLRRER